MELALDVDGWREWLIEFENCLLLNVARLEPLTDWNCWFVILRCLFADSGTIMLVRLDWVSNFLFCSLQPPIVCFCPFVTGGGGIAVRTLFSDADNSRSLLNLGTCVGGLRPLRATICTGKMC